MWSKKAAAHLSLGLLSILAALITGSLVLCVLGLLFSLVVAAMYILQRTVDVEVRRSASSDRVQETERVQVVTRLKAKGMGGGFVELRDRLDARLDVVAGSNYRVLNLPRGREFRMDYELDTPIRGVYGIGPLEVRKSDLFDLFHNVRRLPDSTDGLTVLPRSEEIKEAKVRSLTPRILTGAHPVRQPGIGSQFYALRLYTTADPMKDVNWKATARSGKMIVNQWERESISIVTMVFDARQVGAAGSLAKNPFIQGTRAAVTLAEHFIGERSTLRFVTYGEAVHTIQPDSGERQLHKVTERLAAVEPNGAMPFKDVVHEILPQLNQRSPFILVSSLEEDPTLDEGISMLASRGLNVLVIAPSAPDFLRGAEGAPMDGDEYMVRRLRHQLEVKRLRALGARVVLWEPDQRLELAFMGAL